MQFKGTLKWKKMYKTIIIKYLPKKSTESAPWKIFHYQSFIPLGLNPRSPDYQAS